MTKQEINIAIAKERGFTVAFRGEEHWMSFELKSAEGKVVKCTNSEDMAWKCAPDYTIDLNAMHEAECSLRQNQFHCVHYPHELFKVITGHKWEADMGYFFFVIVNATAIQRAEAYLRVKGKWVD